MRRFVVETPHSLSRFEGEEIAVTDWFLVSQERIRLFADTTEDRQWIHLDRERAKRESPFGTTIAHGFLTLSLMSHLMQQAVEIRSGVRIGINCGLDHVRFTSPVIADSRIRARITLLSTRELPGAIEAIFSVVVECLETAKTCCLAESIVRYYGG
jgi:acyl dehydratase